MQLGHVRAALGRLLEHRRGAGGVALRAPRQRQRQLGLDQAWVDVQRLAPSRLRVRAPAAFRQHVAEVAPERGVARPVRKALAQRRLGGVRPRARQQVAELEPGLTHARGEQGGLAEFRFGRAGLSGQRQDLAQGVSRRGVARPQPHQRRHHAPARGQIAGFQQAQSVCVQKLRIPWVLRQGSRVQGQSVTAAAGPVQP